MPDFVSFKYLFLIRRITIYYDRISISAVLPLAVRTRFGQFSTMNIHYNSLLRGTVWSLAVLVNVYLSTLWNVDHLKKNSL